MYIRWILLFSVLLCQFSVNAQKVYEVSTGTVGFHSIAPQELIKASSSQLKGVLDIQKRVFFFKIPINSFIGFNSPLQQEHFNENYMESGKYPEATYSGKIIEDVDMDKDGTYDIRVKGKLKIHGFQQERIINSHIIIKDGKINLDSKFIVSLADHDIKIPRVVYDKLAPDINVSVNATLVPKQ